MSNILLTSAFTISGGVLVFSISQIIQKFFIEPAHEQKKVIGEILFGLEYYANRYTHPGRNDMQNIERENALEKASDEFRRYACQLKSTTHSVHGYKIFEKLKLVPPHKNIQEAVSNLIRISNSFFNGDGRENSNDAAQTRKLLIVGK